MNDRIWIRCKKCGKGIMVADYDGINIELSGADIAGFILQHINERNEDRWKVSSDLDAEPGFELTTDDSKTSSGQLYFHDYKLWDERKAEFKR